MSSPNVQIPFRIDLSFSFAGFEEKSFLRYAAMATVSVTFPVKTHGALDVHLLPSNTLEQIVLGEQ
jgi:hypothetical protein